MLRAQNLQLAPAGEVVVVPGDIIRFTCSSTATNLHITSVQWLVNGTALQNLSLSNVTENFITVQMKGIGELVFTDISEEYNKTMITCMVNMMMISAPTLLLIQGVMNELLALKLLCMIDSGLLPAVGSLMLSEQSTLILLTWTSPFTLDITNTDPDIAGYCVDVVNSSTLATLHSECGINVTNFTCPISPRSWCDKYTFTITPVNVVGNGMPSSLNYSMDVLCKHMMNDRHS